MLAVEAHALRARPHDQKLDVFFPSPLLRRLEDAAAQTAVSVLPYRVDIRQVAEPAVPRRRSRDLVDQADERVRDDLTVHFGDPDNPAAVVQPVAHDLEEG
ncbi:MAG: hypothetical protein M3Q59_09800 [Actinomycetota bacterium]|nr:hypothetical protein [Actinomycetota bacterium]